MGFKWIYIMCIFTFMQLLLTGCSSETMEDVMREVKSTNLSNENIDDIRMGMSIIDASFANSYGDFEQHPANEHYASQRNYDQYWNKDIIMSVDRETKEILQVGILETNNRSSSELGIKRGSSIEEVIATYGENYFTYEDREQTIYIIGYVDTQNNLELSFRHFNGEVKGINFGYAFDKMSWDTK
ncbi:hypothetical protein [Alkalihalobacterium sp. APHAB7]|uniref:hypothetical protein n=1 Tax=Alkalihalobacterium sp. APHAB7 TaxID=3402081 RepID=UPI003AB09BFD